MIKTLHGLNNILKVNLATALQRFKKTLNEKLCTLFVNHDHCFFVSFEKCDHLKGPVHGYRLLQNGSRKQRLEQLCMITSNFLYCFAEDCLGLLGLSKNHKHRNGLHNV